jgi:gamma-glutamyl:cysteine ligase YbdK (ATP-grasp superfamily)
MGKALPDPNSTPAGTGRPHTFTREDYRRYRTKVRRCLDVFAQMLDHFTFDEDNPMTGLEIEINLVDGRGEPAMRNNKVLQLIDNPVFQAELGLFNLEANIPPRLISKDGLGDYERFLREAFDSAEQRARTVDASLVLIGILPTIMPEHTVLENISANARYRTLNEQIIDARGADIAIDIRGPERLQIHMDSIMPEAANTSVQFHVQVTPANFANYWNASQAIAGVQVALGANSPYLFGRRLWDETRVALFEQTADTRPEELKNQAVRPRVWFGERWITSIFDLFEENVRYFPALLPYSEDEDPEDVIEAGGVPRLAELRLHNGTVYRWNRPVYDISPTDGVPHLRVENRVMSAGPSVVDMLANAAFYFGLVRNFAEADRPVWSQLPYAAAEQNFYQACREGLAATLFWPRGGEIRVVDLVLERLLPAASDGLDRFDVDPAVRDRLLGIIEQRCITGRNGTVWQCEVVDHLEAHGADRPTALRQMLLRYVEYMHANEPVHTWPVN